jgi:hypothetical protein
VVFVAEMRFRGAFGDMERSLIRHVSTIVID